MKHLKIIGELKQLYNETSKEIKKEQSTEFYKKLKDKIHSSVDGCIDQRSALENYKIACRTYLESDYLAFNLGIIAILISFIALIGDEISEFGIAMLVLLLVIVVPVSVILLHKKKAKIIEILYVLENEII